MEEGQQTMSQKDSKMSLGEELFLVHLSRNGDKVHPEDVDREVRKGSSNECCEEVKRSVGEELWLIHCKRSAGADPGNDEEKSESISDKKYKSENLKLFYQVESPRRTIHLRSRNVEIL